MKAMKATKAKKAVKKQQIKKAMKAMKAKTIVGWFCDSAQFGTNPKDVAKFYMPMKVLCKSLE